MFVLSLLLAFNASAGLCALMVAPATPTGAPAWAIQNDPDLTRIAQLLPVKNDARVREHIEFVVRAYEARARREPLSRWSDPFLRAEAMRLLSHLRRTSEHWKRDDAALTTISRAAFHVRAQRAHITYRLLARNLGYLLQTGEPLPWQILFRFTWMASLLEDAARTQYQIRGPSVPPTLAQHFEIDVTTSQEKMRAYAQAVVTDPGATADLPAVDDLVDDGDRLFAQEGIVALPVAEMPTDFERLALGFLPLHWAPVMAPRPRPSRDHYLDLGLKTFGFASPLLRSGSPNDWTLALNESWLAWYALLGGGDPEARRPENESALRVTLFNLRYGAVDALSPDWSGRADLLRFLLDRVLFTSDHRVNAPVLDFFYNGQRHLAALYASPQGHYLDHAQVASALDLMIARLLPLAAKTIREDGLRSFLARHPRDAVSTKLAVAKAFR